ncbi:TetR/AcrR family transcriptional regulator [Anditalea andensis]|uniref:HTH tetR-type domain-containing protein n=1 Tax=Anditalea andensis TaxID=1048983 RepID=A0A074KVG6_9BACT|nr:TetR/AcrR family transcriptional regulator [Anditalea andensis]KEO73971.1 hypothetical protein EL17_07400 [Anditalea andensis]
MEIDIHFPSNDKLYLKNPEQSKLGQKIIAKSTTLIKDLGIEEFTFKKLAVEINSNEASIYRYFENKHNLLVYLISFYWEVLNMKIQFSISSISNPKDKLSKLIDVLVNIEEAGPVVKNKDLSTLHEIVVSESAKAYLTKKVDKECQAGFFQSYEKLVDTISGIFMEVNRDYEFPRALACNLVETTYEQFYFSEHFHGLTELQEPAGSLPLVKRFLQSLMYSVLLTDTQN